MLDPSLNAAVIQSLSEWKNHPDVGVDLSHVEITCKLCLPQVIRFL